MTHLITKTLAAALTATFMAGASVAFAQQTPGMGPGDSAFGGDRSPSLEDRERAREGEMLDYGSTGSINNCETQTWDAEGNCVIDPDLR